MTKPLNELESLGRYKLLHELGRGGMSVVYLAQDTKLGREVAIKCVDISNKSNAKLAQSLRSEAQLLAQLNHPNIVQLYDVVEQQNVLGLVIEFVGGDTLTKRLIQTPSKEVKLKWLAEVAEGLASAHQKGIAHCDLKADNVLITQGSVAKIADFGIAKLKLNDYLEDDGLTRIDSVSGSYFSLSPEQATGDVVDSRTDLFSLGVLIYQSLIGAHPFGDTGNKVALLQRIISAPLELSTPVRSKLGVRLTELISNLLSKKPEDRLYSASEVAELLRGAQSDKSATTPQDDDTLEIPLQAIENEQRSTQVSKKNSWKNRLALVLAGFLVGIALIQLGQKFSSKPTNISYIALDEIEIETSPDFNQELLPLVQSTLQASVEQAVLSLNNTGLISSREFQSIKGNYQVKAKATGVDSILSLVANCGKDKCDLILRKHEGEKMAASMQKNWPVAVQNLTDIRSGLRRELFGFYADTERDDFSQAITETGYREYISILLDSNNGKKSSSVHLSRIEGLIEKQPLFLPAYDLARRVAQRLKTQTGEKIYLASFEDILEQAPAKLKNSSTILDAKISLKLMQDKHDEAIDLYTVAQKVVADEEALLNLEANLAYFGDKPADLLKLDKKNVDLRPSAKNFYNLATSEYAFGNYEDADIALNKALGFYPNYSFALSLRATIAMKWGELDRAIENYSAAINLNPSGTNLTNIGLAFTLSGDHSQALESQKMAMKEAPRNVGVRLNIADAYNAAGQIELSKKFYYEVIELTTPPKNASDYRLRVQALAHVGDFVQAIKTLNLANKKFPDDAKLEYVSALVHALSGNSTAAVVAVDSSIQQGTGRIWFSFSWFYPLCTNSSFRDLTYPETQPLCNR